MNEKPYQSETSKHREDLINFCEGYGIDVGSGGDPIKQATIAVDYPDGCMAYCGEHPVQLGGDARSLPWFNDNALDYVYSSHCLEDFLETKEILLEWSRVLKKGGKLVLLLPNQQRYEKHCKKFGEPSNPAHKIKEFSLEYIKNIIESIPYLKVIFEKDILDDYSFEIVIEKTEETVPRKIQELENKVKRINNDYEKMKNHPWVKLGFVIKNLARKK
jgi:ubiquinone/menaquinone biosynthesis C-methylase UbiE